MSVHPAEFRRRRSCNFVNTQHMSACPFPDSLQNIVDRRSLQWIFVGGKGGVGKTTISCSLAIELAKTRNRVLTDPAHNLSDSFGQKFGKEPTPVRGWTNLLAMELELDEETLLHASNEARETGHPMGQMLGPLMDAASNTFPGMDEALSFLEMMRLVKSSDCDVVVFDTAPTGHTIRLLSFPDVVLQMTAGMAGKRQDMFGQLMSSVVAMMGGANAPGGSSGGPNDMTSRAEEMYNNAKSVKDLFQDSARCTFICVCIAEFLSVYETERLVQELSKREISVDNIVMNNVIYVNENDTCQRCNRRAESQKKYVETVMELYDTMHVTLLPLQDKEVRSVPDLIAFSKLLTKPAKIPRGVGV